MQSVNDQLNEMFDSMDVSDVLKMRDLSSNPNKKNPVKAPRVTYGINEDWWRLLTPTPEASTLLQETIAAVINEDIKPSSIDILNFARFTPPSQIKVIIIGQDPYDTQNHAHGLAFSSQQINTPRTLGNIYKALIESKIINTLPSTNNLTSWAAQGVLLLNTALTTLTDKPEAHLNTWGPYMRCLLGTLASNYQNLVVILWGKKAEVYESYFANHIILKYKHPSPAAGNFADCPNFIEANNILTSLGKTPINWNPDINTWVEVFTDGSSLPNKTGPEVQSGYSAIFTAGSLAHLKLYGKTPNTEPHYSNNIRAEGTALYRAMLKVSMMPLESRMLFHIVSDCEFWINMLRTWVPAWIERGGINEIQNHKNPDIVKDIWLLYCALINSGTYIVLTHVYSHDKEIKGKKSSTLARESTEYRRFLFNKLADALANHIRVKFQNGQYGEMTTEMECNGLKY